MGLAEKVIEGDLRAAARLITNIDDETPQAFEELKILFPKTGSAHIIGVTGSPGVGKSTLVDKITRAFRIKSKTVGVIALDPTSPFTGGAILGDRIRMQGHTVDEGVFIRSVATRGCLGGLSYSTNDVAKVMDAMGKDVIIIETVGVGQSEVEIVNSCHTSIVVLSPGLGDDVQMMKAGILEIADIFVINKADYSGAEKVEADLLNMMQTRSDKTQDWTPKIYKTIAEKNSGIDALITGIYEHRKNLFAGDKIETQIKKKLQAEFSKILRARLMCKISDSLLESGLLEQIVDDIFTQKTDPYTIAEEILAKTKLAVQ